VPDGHNGDKENVNYIHTTYLDNIENLSESFVLGLKDMQKNRPEKFRHQIMGGWLDRAEGVVFTDWSIGDFPKDMDTIFGQDFGFSVDPSVLVEVAVDKKLKKVWAKLHFYKPGMATSQLYESNRRYAGKNLIVCDNSEPRLLSEFKMKGLNVTPTIKKKGSILTGIAMMQDYHIVIDSNSIDLIKEFNNYSWKMRGSVPRDDWNHGIDALRYACEYLLMRSVPKGMYIVN
jgi:phage terminase large subunit